MILIAKEKLLQQQPLKGKIAVVCGASEGIGKATAKEFVLLGGSVCINARDPNKLEQAKQDIESAKKLPDQFVETISCDAADMNKLKPLLDDFVKKRGIPDYLINVVGFATPQYIENHKLEDYKKHMDTNYYGQLVPTLILLPYFMKEKKGHIGFVSSVAAIMGIIGYTAYTPTKAAILGLADALRNELHPYNIKVSVILPPDVQTPQFERENKTKPKECFIMSGKAGLLQPEDIAQPFLEGMLKNKFYITPGEAKKYWMLKRHLPNLVTSLTDKELMKARKKLGKK